MGGEAGGPHDEFSTTGWGRDDEAMLPNVSVYAVRKVRNPTRAIPTLLALALALAHTLVCCQHQGRDGTGPGGTAPPPPPPQGTTRQGHGGVTAVQSIEVWGLEQGRPVDGWSFLVQVWWVRESTVAGISPSSRLKRQTKVFSCVTAEYCV